MTKASGIHVRLLGRFTVAWDDAFSKPIHLSTKKVSALLAFLAMSPQQAATREQLATLLWGNFSDRQARQSLRQALLSLRKDLHPANIVVADTDAIRLRPGSVSVDALNFEALSASADFQDLERAVGLVQGEFLAGFGIEEEPFEDWIRQQRRRFETTGTGALESYAQKCDAVGKGPQAIATAERLLALDPLREDWQRLALKLYARHRGHNEAMAQARGFTELLQRQLEVEPEPQTQALIEDIRRGAIATATAASEARALVASDAAAGISVAPPPAVEADVDHQPPDWDAPQTPLAPANRWVSLRQWPSRGMTAGAVAMVVLLVGFVALTNGRPIPPPAAAMLPASAQADPWQSPQLPSKRLADVSEPTKRKTIIPIAVLPLVTFGETAGSLQLVAEMMTDDLINILSRVPTVRVISRQTSRSYRGQPIDIAVIGSELGVRYILEGSVRALGDTLRVNVALIDPTTRLPVWSARIERNEKDRHSVQDEIVGRLARELHLEVLQIESERGSKEPGVAELNFKGWAAMLAYGVSGRDALAQAEGHFKQALARDPQDLVARTGLGSYHAMAGALQLDADPDGHLAKGQEVLQQVLREAPRGDTAHFFMGMIHQLHSKFDDAIDSYERALESNPSNAGAHAHIGHTLLWMRRASEALEHIRYALRLSPRDIGRSTWLRFAGEAELELMHYEQAIEHLRLSNSINPRQPYTVRALAAAHALSGQMDEARRYMSEVKKLAPHTTQAQMPKRTRAPLQSWQPELVRGLRLVPQSPS